MSDFDEERVFRDLTLRRKDKRVQLEQGDFRATFELGSLTEMFEEPDLAAAGTTRVIASPPTQYLLFGSGTLGLDNATGGDYRLTWITVPGGVVTDGGTVSLGGSDESFEPPAEGEVILVLKRLGR